MNGLLSPCEEWEGTRHPRGYGRIRTGENRDRLAHVVALEQNLGRPLLPGMRACHHCDNPPCVNPEHLYEGTPADNSRDMVARGRSAIARGTHPQANKTHCAQGHPFDEENTGTRPKGGRYCRACNRKQSRARMRRKRLERG